MSGTGAISRISLAGAESGSVFKANSSEHEERDKVKVSARVLTISFIIYRLMISG